MNTQKLKTHWVADIYPLNQFDIDAMAVDIKNNGQTTPIKVLKDGTIIDGRNRWMACDIAGVKQVVEVINPDGEEVSEERLFALSTSCNSMRRDMTTSLRACLAAEAWQKLKDTMPETRGQFKDESKNTNFGVFTFEQFAKERFKVGKTYARQALTILNFDDKLFNEARTDLSGAHEIYVAAKQAAREKANAEQILESIPDLAEKVGNGTISKEDALAIAESRSSAARDKEQTRKFMRQSIVKCTLEFLDMIDRNIELNPEEVSEWMVTEKIQAIVKEGGRVGPALDAGIRLLQGLRK